MSQFIESIKLKNGELSLLSFHEARLNQTRSAVFGEHQPIALLPYLTPFLQEYKHGLYKVRVLYSNDIDHIEIHPYEQRVIRRLQVVQGALDYQYKSVDRAALHQLYEQRNNCDDVIIVREDMVTDSYYANLVFYDGHHWYTPATPLLPGVQRAYLLHEHIIQAKDIYTADIPNFQRVKLINAMMNWEDAPTIAIEHIVMDGMESV